jgi:predicted dehydrogenase
MLSKCLSRRDFLTRSAACAAGFVASNTVIEAQITSGADRNNTIKIAQVGTAHAHARGKMESLRKLADYYEVVGIFEPDAEKQKDAMQKEPYKNLHWFDSLEQLLNFKGLKAVAVETYKRELVPTSMLCAKAGMHIHMDKPAGESLSQFKTLLDEMTRQKLTLQMGYMFRNNPAFQFCFEAVKKGWLGNIFEIHGVISKTINDTKRKALAQYSGGTMFELGCHLIDALVAVMGKPDNVSAFTRKTKPDLDNLNDNQLAVFEYPKATATIRSALVEVDGTKRRQFYVCGNKGTVEIKPLEPPQIMLILDQDQGKFKKGSQSVELPEMTGRYDDQLIELAMTINGQLENNYPPSHDLAVHEAVLRASGLPID